MAQQRWIQQAGAGTRQPSRGAFEVWLTATEGEVILRGELDAYTAPQLNEFLAGVAAKGHRRIVLDLGELEFIDVTGVGTLVSANNGAHREGAELVLRSPSDQARKILEITGLNEVFIIEDR